MFLHTREGDAGGERGVRREGVRGGGRGEGGEGGLGSRGAGVCDVRIVRRLKDGDQIFKMRLFNLFRVRFAAPSNHENRSWPQVRAKGSCVVTISFQCCVTVRL